MQRSILAAGIASAFLFASTAFAGPEIPRDQQSGMWAAEREQRAEGSADGSAWMGGAQSGSNYVRSAGDMGATGFIGASYEWAELEASGGGADSDGVALNGSIAFQPPALNRLLGTDAIGVQLDAGYIAGDDDEDAFMTTLHAFTRNDQWLWGGYVGAADVEDVGVWGAGGELNHYRDRLTLAGSAGWTIVDDADTDVFSIAGEARYFPNPDTRFEVGLGWADIDVDDGAAEDAILASVGAERQISGWPISAFAGYTTAFFDDDVDSNRLSIGVRYNFAPTLMDRDRSGPSLSQSPLATRLLF